MKIIVLLCSILIFGLVSFAIWSIKYLEDFSYSYNSYEQLEKSGMIEAGWYPGYLPKSITNFEGNHNIDTNYTEASFSYDVKDNKGVEFSCKVTSYNEKEKQYLCPHNSLKSSIIILKNNGKGYFLSKHNDI